MDAAFHYRFFSIIEINHGLNLKMKRKAQVKLSELNSEANIAKQWLGRKALFLFGVNSRPLPPC